MASSEGGLADVAPDTMPQPTTGQELETLATKVDETLATEAEETLASNEAQIESKGQGGAESSCRNAGASSPPADEDTEKTLEHAVKLMQRGSKGLKDRVYTEAAECFSRAVEIRVAHYGELAPECASAYYKYGCALLYKAQEETDPLGTVPKKEVNSREDSSKDGIVKDGECSTASSVSDTKQSGDSSHNEGESDDVAVKKGQVEDGDEDSNDEDVAEADEDDSDLNLAWKMLDVARAIVEKHPGDTMEKVDILSALAEVALEREDIETSTNDYLKALSILEHLVEPDSRQIAELNFRICLCLEVGSKAEEAIPYCQKAISICKVRVEHLRNELRCSTGLAETSVVPDLNQKELHQSSGVPRAELSVSDKEAEIETLTGLSSEMEKKLEDLQQLVLKPSMGIGSSQLGNVNSSVDLDSPTVSTAHTNGTGGVAHLGVVGRGIKRPLMNPGSAEPSLMKKPSMDSSEDKGEASVS